MKNGVLLAITYILAFVLVTGGIFFYNAQYTNIFRFDFTPRALADSTKAKSDSLKAHTMVDSVAADTLNNTHALQTATNDFAGNISQTHNNLTGEKEPADKETTDEGKEKTPADMKKNNDPEYEKWKSATVKLYEAMESKQVAQVIVNFKDEIARDIIYSMKKKKAAEVLALLPPEVVHRYTRIN